MVISIIIEANGQWMSKDARHGLAIALRALVELETGITDPDDLDGLCGDLLTEARIDHS